MAKRAKGQTSISIFPDWCKGCGICVAFCPAHVLELDEAGKAWAAREADCINCGFCELHCPDFAIMVKSRPETPKGKGPENGEAAASAKTDGE